MKCGPVANGMIVIGALGPGTNWNSSKKNFSSPVLLFDVKTTARRKNLTEIQ